MGVYGFSQAEIGRIVGLLPCRLSFTLKEAVDESKELRMWLKQHDEIYSAVQKFEGIMEHFSTHAGGVLICKGLTSILPVMNTSEDRDKLIVALDKHAVEELGHYKFDILGLKSLILMQNITKYTGEINWHEIDFEDKKIYKMLCDGNVAGIFQLSDQKEKVMQQKPRCFEDLIAINALIRPGVGDWRDYIERRKNGDCGNITQKYLEPTSGIIVYQDQYLLLARTYAGWDIAYSDKHIRKNKDILADRELKEKFLEDGKHLGYSEEELLLVWNSICEVVSGGYGFNRAHSTSYAKLSFQTAYMKKYYPKEFYAAYLTQNLDDAEKVFETINLLKTEGIQILPPDVNKSTDKFIPTDDGILFPLTAIQGIGGSAWYEINRLKPIKDFDDFIDESKSS